MLRVGGEVIEDEIRMQIYREINLDRNRDEEFVFYDFLFGGGDSIIRYEDF